MREGAASHDVFARMLRLGISRDEVVRLFGGGAPETELNERLNPL